MMLKKVLEVEVIAYREEEKKNLTIFFFPNEKNQNLNSKVEDFFFL